MPELARPERFGAKRRHLCGKRLAAEPDKGAARLFG
jgi:hypothetical protein